MQSENHHFLTALALAALIAISSPSATAAVVTYIDLLTTTQTNTTYNNSVTNTVATAGAVGGFRTATLTSTDNDLQDNQSTLRVQTNAGGGGPRLVLTSGNDASANYLVTWGGASGTGFAPVDFKGGLGTNFYLPNSTLNFSLRTADLASPYTWTFRDTNNVTATYTSTFPANNLPSPPIDYAISLASFANSGTIDWSAINFITLAGGGVPSLDLVFGSPFSVTAAVPEPGTWAAAGLLLVTAVYIRWRRSRSATTEEVPTTV